MCLAPITIVNPSKYINLSRRDAMLLQVPCGKCAECRQTLSNQWLLRTYYEFENCLKNGGYCYFDTLTYREDSVPRISDRFSGLPYNYKCFDSSHTHKFLDNLAKKLERKYDSSFRYFLSSEYGDKTARPHYHLLLFVFGKITPFELSNEISSLWRYGRTDGAPYKSQYYVENHNTIKVNNKETLCRTSNYVTKYVQKSCKYDAMIEQRIAECLDFVSQKVSDQPNEWMASRHQRKVRSMFKRKIGQFHRQSQNFGASELGNLDLISLARDGVIFMPHWKFVKLAVPIPMYYRRKLFQQQVVVDGCRCWTDTEVGTWFKKERKIHLQKKIQDRYNCVAAQYGFRVNNTLSEYVLDRRGRNIAPLPASDNLYQKLERVDCYAYIHDSDIHRFGRSQISSKYYGNSTTGYTTPRGVQVELEKWLAENVYLDEFQEKLLDKITESQKALNASKNRLLPLKQRLEFIHHKRFVDEL